MSWRVVYSDQAKQDLRSIYEYIAFSLLEKETASQLYKEIATEINSLDISRTKINKLIFEDGTPAFSVEPVCEVSVGTVKYSLYR